MVTFIYKKIYKVNKMENKIFNKIVNIIRESKYGVSSIEISKELSLDRHTIAKYLEVLKTNGLIDYKRIGMAKVWYPLESTLLSLLENDTEMGNNLRGFLDSFGGDVNIIDKNMKVVYKNKEDKNPENISRAPIIRCYKIHKDGRMICKNCVVVKTLKTGEKQSIVNTVKKNGKKTNLKLTTIPIKNYKNETVAVVELVNV